MAHYQIEVWCTRTDIGIVRKIAAEEKGHKTHWYARGMGLARARELNSLWYQHVLDGSLGRDSHGGFFGLSIE